MDGSQNCRHQLALIKLGISRLIKGQIVTTICTRGNMPKSRREFLTQTTLSLLGATVATASLAQNSSSTMPPGAPTTFGAAPPVGPEVSAATFGEAEKLVQVELTPADRAQAAGNWRTSMAPYYERRVGPRKVAIDSATAPWSRWDCTLPGTTSGPSRNEFVRSVADAGPLPSSDEQIAFAPVTKLSRWIETRKLTSQR